MLDQRSSYTVLRAVNSLRAGLIALLSPWVLAGCSEDPVSHFGQWETQTGGAGGSGGGSSTGTFASVASILSTNCGAPACHGGGPDGQKLVLNDMATLYDALMTTVVHYCDSKLLVVPNDPANSALTMLPTWQCYYFVMPMGCLGEPTPCLPAEDLSSITAWISAGAPR